MKHEINSKKWRVKSKVNGMWEFIWFEKWVDRCKEIRCEYNINDSDFKIQNLSEINNRKSKSDVAVHLIVILNQSKFDMMDVTAPNLRSF